MVHVDRLVEHDLFRDKYWFRPKDATDWFFALKPEMQADVIHEIAYGLDSISNDLHEILCICKEQDDVAEQMRTSDAGNEMKKMLLEIIRNIEKGERWKA